MTQAFPTAPDAYWTSLMEEGASVAQRIRARSDWARVHDAAGRNVLHFVCAQARAPWFSMMQAQKALPLWGERDGLGHSPWFYLGTVPGLVPRRDPEFLERLTETLAPTLVDAQGAGLYIQWLRDLSQTYALTGATAHRWGGVMEDLYRLAPKLPALQRWTLDDWVGGTVEDQQRCALAVVVLMFDRHTRHPAAQVNEPMTWLVARQPSATPEDLDARLREGSHPLPPHQHTYGTLAVGVGVSDPFLVSVLKNLGATVSRYLEADPEHAHEALSRCTPEWRGALALAVWWESAGYFKAPELEAFVLAAAPDIDALFHTAGISWNRWVDAHDIHEGGNPAFTRAPGQCQARANSLRLNADLPTVPPTPRAARRLRM